MQDNTPLSIALAGANGRMGQAIIQAIRHMPHFSLSVLLLQAGKTFSREDFQRHTDLDLNQVQIVTDPNEITKNVDIFIDFTRPEATLNYLQWCHNHHKNMVIGTTGFQESEKKMIQAASHHIGIVFSANFSIGINLMFSLLEKTANTLGEDADIEIIEAHHRHKVDAPSGTALAMGEVITKTLGWTNDAYRNHYHQDHAREPKTLGFSSIRAGDIVGEHTVIFASEGERVEISHKASSRLSFARGALHAAHWLSKKERGLFDMQDVLHRRENS